MAEDEKSSQAGAQFHNFSSYLGLSFGLFLASLPTNSLSLIHNLHSRTRDLSFSLFQAEEQLKQMQSRRKEDSKANARVVEIFASHRNAWQAEEKRLLHQIDAATEEFASLRAKLEEFQSEKEDWKSKIHNLEREVAGREEMIVFMSRNTGYSNDFAAEEEEEEVSGGYGNCENYHGGGDDNVNFAYGQQQSMIGGFNSDFLAASASKFWSDKANPWQDTHYESLESLYHMKHFVPRRESPWKVDGDSTRISSKLKLLEQEILNLENVDKIDPSKVSSQMRKQAKRYQALAGKIDDLCRRMQACDPCEATLSPEFQIQRQTEFLLESFQLQQRASETAQKQMALQTKIGMSNYGDDEMDSQAKVNMRRSFDSIRNNLKEVQRNLEIWLARIIGDLEGILSRDGASKAKEYYGNRYPFVQ